MYFTCSDCGSKDIVEDYHDGSMVCRMCGLVVSPFLLDDRPQNDANRNIHYTSFYQDPPKDIEVSNALAMLDIENQDIESSVLHQLATFCQNDKGKGRACVLKAHAIFEVCRRMKILRVTKELICACFGIEPKTLLQSISKNHEQAQPHVPLQTINERLVKLATLFIRDSKLRMRIVKCASEIEIRLKANKDYMNKKTSKMDAVILYHVCIEHGVKLKKGELITDAGISNVTFNKHLKLLKSLLLIPCNNRKN